MLETGKKILCTLLVVVMCLTVAPLSGFVDFGITASALADSGSCGDNVTYTYDSSTKELVITGTGAMYDSYEGSRFYNSDIKSVIIEDGVTSIGWRAFEDCRSLESVTIGDSVTSIGWYAFAYCESLTSVTIGGSVTSIGDYAFYNCTSLANVTIPDSVTSIGDYAFGYCTSLESVTIGDSVTSIGDYAFRECTSLTNVTIPDSVTSIGVSAFRNCTSLESVTIPDSVTSIGWYAFEDCTSLASITVDADNQYYSSDEYGVLFNKDKTALIQYPMGNTRTAYTIPDSVTSIGSSAFRNCTSLASVTIPDSVTSIGGAAFYNCTSLESITIPDSVTTIGDDAFYNCTSLESVTIPDSVTSIGVSAFYDCTSLTDVYYGGTEEQWNSITIGEYNECLTGATIHFGTDIHTHSYTSTVTKAPTCWREGTKTFSCSCGDTYVEKIDKLDHEVYRWKVKKKPTCTEAGLEWSYCLNCDMDLEREIPATGHTIIKYTRRATPDEDGAYVTACDVCNEVFEEIPFSRPTVFKLSTSSCTYNGKKRTPSVTVKDADGKVLKEGKDYEIIYPDGMKLPGEYDITVLFIGEYLNEKHLKFTIKPKAPTKISASQSTSVIKLTWSKSTGATGYRVYQYSPSKDKFVLKASVKGTTTYRVTGLKTGTEYQFKIKPYYKTDDGTVVWGSASEALITATDPAKPTIKVSSTAKTKATLSWTNVSGESGYQIYYSTSKSSGYKKLTNVSANKTKGTVSKLKSGKTYYFKVRAYKKVGGKTIYGSFSSVKSVKIK